MLLVIYAQVVPRKSACRQLRLKLPITPFFAKYDEELWVGAKDYFRIADDAEIINRQALGRYFYMKTTIIGYPQVMRKWRR